MVKVGTCKSGWDVCELLFGLMWGIPGGKMGGIHKGD